MKLLKPLLIWLCCLAVLPAHAEETAVVEIEPVAKTTEHRITIGGSTVDYTATVGWLIMKEEGKPVARMGYTAYHRKGVTSQRERPITFAFNGGPGSSSLWLHMGILGPQRVLVNDAGYAAPPPAQRVANEFSVLDITDIVMIDPVGTGFSKALGEAENKKFWGVDQDIASVAQFIKQYVSDKGLWGSPKFVLGESYGGIRGAGLAHYLQSRMNMNLNGLMLVSPFMDSTAGRDGVGLDLPHALFFPGLAATAWYHDVLKEKPANLAAFASEVEQFALNEYLPVLQAGYTLSPERMKAMAEKLAAYTGTSAAYWELANLRVSHQQFLQELQREQRLIAGRIDSRFSGPATNSLAESMNYDPFFPSVGPAYTAAFFDYLHNDLEFGRDEDYRTSAWPIEWDWSHKDPSGRTQVGVSVLPDLSMAMTMNPGLHVHVQQGYYDLATPFAATNYYLRHLDIPKQARGRIRVDYYEAGHMMYLHDESMKKYRDDLVAFIRGALPSGQ